MAWTRKEATEDRRQLKAAHRHLFRRASARNRCFRWPAEPRALGAFGEVESVLFRHDPMGIYLESNTDDGYDPEVGTILPRLQGCSGPEDVCRVVHEEFVHWFGADTAGTCEHYSALSAEIWQVWQKFRNAGEAEQIRAQCEG